MGFKRLAVCAVALMLLSPPAALAAGGNADIAATVPQLLTATSDKNSQSVECSLGDAVADAVRLYLKSDVAIVCGGDLVANLPSGKITWNELRNAFAEDRPLSTATITIRQLREILEAGLSHVSLDESEKINVQTSMYAGFPQVSGFTLYYDPSAPPGRRVHDILIGGKRLKLDDDTQTVTLAATKFILEGGYGLPEVTGAVSSGLTLADVTARYLNSGMAADPITQNRINAMGTADVPVSGWLIAGVVVMAVTLSWVRGKLSLKRFSNFER